MEKRTCKNSNLELSVLGLGCWSFGGGSYWGERDQKEVEHVVRASVDLGINYFDTAEVYNEGRSEISLGEAIQGIPRDRIIIGTKVNPSNCYPDVLVKHCEDSLKRLKTDHIDIYMIHWPIHPHSLRHYTNDEQIINNPPSIVDAYETMMRLKEQGKIRHFGVSKFGSPRLDELPDLGNAAVNQLPYNLLCRAVEYDVLEKCDMNGIGVVGYMGLMQGILTGKFPTFDSIPPKRRRTRHFHHERTEEARHGEDGCEDETAQALDEIQKICDETGYSMTEISIRWILANPLITCTLAGASSISQLEENVKAAEGTLSQDVVEALNEATRPVKEALGNHIDIFEGAENDRTI
jgi:aryl-alcohol dehydrogenase-like predicted oxidoreductase